MIVFPRGIPRSHPPAPTPEACTLQRTNTTDAFLFILSPPLIFLSLSVFIPTTAAMGELVFSAQRRRCRSGAAATRAILRRVAASHELTVSPPAAVALDCCWRCRAPLPPAAALDRC